MWKVESLKLTLLPVSVVSVVCDTRSNQNVYYFSLMNRYAIWKLVEETANMSIICGNINNAGQVDGDFSVARFSSIRGVRLGTNSIYIADKVNTKCKIRSLDLNSKTVNTVFTMKDAVITSFVLDKEENLIFSDNSKHLIVRVDKKGNQFPVFIANNSSSQLMMDETFQTLYVMQHTLISKISTNSWKVIENITIPEPTPSIADVTLDSSECTFYGYSASNIWYYDIRKNRCGYLKITNTDHFFDPPKGKIVVDRNGCICVWNSQGGRRLRPPKLPWKFARLLWIGKWKNSDKECLIATLPADIIREIIGGWNHAYLTNY